MSCTPTPSFPTAASMEAMATNNAVVWEEICAIQQAVLAASSQCSIDGGQFCTTVGGNSPMTFISGVSAVKVVAPGAGYVQDTPALVFIPPNGSAGTGATGTVTTNGGNIMNITITSGGTGYQPMTARILISSAAGSGAMLDPLVDAAGRIVAINIVNPGSGYTIDDSIIASRAVLPHPEYVDAIFKIASVSTSGQILAIVVKNTGSGYQDSVTTIDIVSALNPAFQYMLGTGFQASVLTDTAGVIRQIVILDTGNGYITINPYLIISDSGSGANTQVNLIGNTIGSVTVLTPGTNYTQSAIGMIFNPPTAPLPNPPTAHPAEVAIITNNNTYGTNPQQYWAAWAGTATNRPISAQLNQVLSYFKGLGYTISIQSNPATGNTIQWKICW